MPTPAKDPFLLEKWKKRYANLIVQGYSKNQAIKSIAKKYQTTRDVIYYWLTPERKQKIQAHWQKYIRRPGIGEKLRNYHKKRYQEKKKKWEYYAQFSEHMYCLCEKIFAENSSLTCDEIYERLLLLKGDKKYKPVFNEIFSVLPIKEIKPGVYEFKREF